MTGMAPGIIADSDIPPPPNGPVDFGATSLQILWWAYQGTHQYSGEGPRRNLRLIATIESANYLIVAVKADLGITDLGQIRGKRWPVRVLIDSNDVAPAVLANYGLSKQTIEAAGGHVGNGIDPAERKNFDVIIYGGTLANAPEFNVWYEVSQKYDLTYLQLPDALLDKLARDYDMQRHDIPNGLLRGIHRPIPTVTRSGHAVYGRDDMPDDFAYTVAEALDEHQDLLPWSHLNLSYNPKTVWKAFGVPLHPGAGGTAFSSDARIRSEQNLASGSGF
jgi:TRAP transporter TAXI family solute receptor